MVPPGVMQRRLGGCSVHARARKLRHQRLCRRFLPPQGKGMMQTYLLAETHGA